MLLVGYCFGIRSERRLWEEVHLNLANRWFCRLDLSEPAPNYSTFSKNRHGRFRESKLLRHLFEKTVARCITNGLVSGQGFRKSRQKQQYLQCLMSGHLPKRGMRKTWPRLSMLPGKFCETGFSICSFPASCGTIMLRSSFQIRSPEALTFSAILISSTA